ncbi:YfhO family protein, partial [Streptococcus mutans]|nr:YfhO family protein [Streptococcus mutans]
LPSGKHQIKLYYIPQGLIYGSLITLLSLIFVISILRKSRIFATQKVSTDVFLQKTLLKCKMEARKMNRGCDV